MADLRARMQAGEWERGEQLPTVSELATYYGVSAGTAAKALRELAAEGLVNIVPRWGTFRA